MMEIEWIVTEIEWGIVDVEIEGITPLLMHNAEKMGERAKPLPGASIDPNAEARKYAYIAMRNGKEELYVPSVAVKACILNGAKGNKMGKYSAATILAGCIRIEPDKLWLGTDKYEIDVRSAVNPKAGRVMVYRPKIKNWKLNFQLLYLKKLVDPGAIKPILQIAGIKAGLLSYRPANGGEFGMFKVNKYEIIK